MGHEEDGELRGPNLEEGIERSELEEGQPFLGHAHGKQVILVLQGDDIFAANASCTHYGGPLDEGVVTDGQIRCPWHHASFDLSDGTPSAPAHEPLACFEVEESDGRIRVGQPRSRRAPETPRKQPQSVVIIGAGAAGAACAETLRRSGYEGPIHLVAGDAQWPVDRPNLSKDFLAGEAPDEWLPLHEPEFYEEHDIEFVNQRATGIDREHREVRLDDGETIPFDALLIATGARPRRLDIPGAELEHVHTLRSFDDAESIIADAEDSSRAVVIGASFIGLETAASLRNRDIDVTVVDPAGVPLEHVLGTELGKAIQTIHEGHGVSFKMGHKPTEIDDEGVSLDHGEKLPADLVIIGVGVEPRTELAEEAGLDVEDGVMVDDKLSAGEGIFVAGDVARYPYNGATARIEHWMVAERQGQTVARNMLGSDEPFDAVPFFWSRHFDDKINYVGHADSWDDVEIHGSIAERDATVVYRKGGDIKAVATIGRDDVSLKAEIAMQQGDTQRLEEVVSR